LVRATIDSRLVVMNSCSIFDVESVNARQWLSGRAGDRGFGQAGQPHHPPPQLALPGGTEVRDRFLDAREALLDVGAVDGHA
jgi:hypothetical protein